jgi:hypothetical protein
MQSFLKSTPRTEGFRPFSIQSVGGFGGYDFAKINDLSDEEFAERYLGEMTRYFFEHGRHLLEQEAYGRSVNIDRGLRPISCSDCPNPIDNPRDLRRYYGATLHHSCFIERWRKEKKDRDARPVKKMRQYWDKVATLNL